MDIRVQNLWRKMAQGMFIMHMLMALFAIPTFGWYIGLLGFEISLVGWLATIKLHQNWLEDLHAEAEELGIDREHDDEDE